MRTISGLFGALMLNVAAFAANVPLPSTPQLPTKSPVVDVTEVDRGVSPGDDFFRYANGVWLARTEIPADQRDWGTFSELNELSNQRTADLIREVAASGDATPEVRKVADYYNSFMDEAAIEVQGLKPLRAEIRAIDAIGSRQALASALGRTLEADVDILNATELHTGNLLGLWVAQDLDEPSQYSPFLVQGGLGMPDREYYLSDEPKMLEIRARYLKHIVATLKLGGSPDAEHAAALVLGLETKMAKAHWDLVQSEDVLKGNNHWQFRDFAKRAPGMDWSAYFYAAGLGAQQRFTVWQPSAITGLSALVASAPLATWKNYLRFHLLNDNAQYLGKTIVAQSFDFYDRTLNGTPEMSPRWKRAVNSTNDALGDAVGKLYVARYFSPANKERVQLMVRNLVAAFANRIDKLEWMAASTKAEAKAKLAALKVGVGYPDTWINYGALEIRKGDVFGNHRRAQRFWLQRALRKLGQPVDRGEWAMVPQVVNALNLPAMNALNFPASILQPPYLDSQRDPVMEYGSIGAIIGHEISHSFDDQGAQFDATGRLRNWWTSDDFAHFKAAGESLAKQFDGYRPYPDIHVNGYQTLSENIADVAGLSAAFDAWQQTRTGTAQSAKSENEQSPEQLFFVSYGQAWKEKIREPALRRQVVTNGHAPAEYRADTVRNIDAWYEAFAPKPGQKLYLAPADRVRVW